MAQTAKRDLKQRTNSFALRVLRLADALPKTRAGNTVGPQLARSGSSVAANYRAACLARSKREFIAKICIVCEEIDEARGWLDTIADLALVAPKRLISLRDEARQLTAIFIAARKTSRGARP